MFQKSRTAWIRTGLLAGLISLLLPPARQAGAQDTEDLTNPAFTKLFSGNLDGSNMQRFPNLKQFSKQGSACCSMDGKLLAFDMWRPVEAPAGARVIIINMDGTKPRVFEDAAMPSFSPGGRRVIVSRPKAGGIWVINIDGQEQEEFVQVDPDGWGADWSPDGRLVYAKRGIGGANLKVINLVEGGQTMLFEEDKTPYSQIFWNMAWSRDSKSIAFVGADQDGKLELGVVDARGATFGLKRRPEESLSQAVAWSPDNSQLLFSKSCPERGRVQIYSIVPNLDQAPKLLPGQDPEWHYTDPVYTADGKQLLFSCSTRKKDPAK